LINWLTLACRGYEDRIGRCSGITPTVTKGPPGGDGDAAQGVRRWRALYPLPSQCAPGGLTHWLLNGCGRRKKLGSPGGRRATRPTGRRGGHENFGVYAARQTRSLNSCRILERPWILCLPKRSAQHIALYTLRGEWGDVTNLGGYTGLAQLYCGAH
jgi:hypothetical protein